LHELNPEAGIVIFRFQVEANHHLDEAKQFVKTALHHKHSELDHFVLDQLYHQIALHGRIVSF
jgi:hypothetical protein